METLQLRNARLPMIFPIRGVVIEIAAERVNRAGERCRIDAFLEAEA